METATWSTTSPPPWFLLSRRKPPEAIQILMRRARRNPLNWVGPVCIVVVCSLLASSMILFLPLSILSLVLFNYLIFFGVLLWSVKDAVRWRRGRALLEGTMLTSLTPEEVVLIPFHTQMAIWRPVLWLHVPVWTIGVFLATKMSGVGYSVPLARHAILPPIALLQLQLAHVSGILALSMGSEAAIALAKGLPGASMRLFGVSIFHMVLLTVLGIVSAFVSFGVCAWPAGVFSLGWIERPLVGFALLLAITAPLFVVGWLNLWFAAFHLHQAQTQLFGEAEPSIESGNLEAGP